MGRQPEGKYDAFLPNLPKFSEEAPYQQKIDEAKKTIVTNDAVTLAQGYIEARRAKDDLLEDIKKINIVITAYEQLLADSKERGAAGWGDYGAKDNALRLMDGDVIRVQNEPYGQVTDKEAFRKWCIANGYERTLHMWPSTMQALLRELLTKGLEEPEGCKTFSKPKIVYVPAKE